MHIQFTNQLLYILKTENFNSNTHLFNLCKLECYSIKSLVLFSLTPNIKTRISVESYFSNENNFEILSKDILIALI